MVRKMLAKEEKLLARIKELEGGSQKPKQDSAMMTALKSKIKDKVDEELKIARQTGDKRQLMVRALLEKEKKLNERIVELEGGDQTPKKDSAMMTAFKEKIKHKIDEELSKARQQGDKRQLMVRALLANEKKLKARIEELEGGKPK